jgi:hypothetical protein
MAWEKRDVGQAYYYRSVRRDGKVVKVYYGGGTAGRLAAEADARRRAERRAAAAAARASEAHLAALMLLNAVLSERCQRLAAASLLAAGYRRPARHNWRAWRDGRRTLGLPG